eukprot:811516-Rhodomonas_salina.1
MSFVPLRSLGQYRTLYITLGQYRTLHSKCVPQASTTLACPTPVPDSAQHVRTRIGGRTSKARCSSS